MDVRQKTRVYNMVPKPDRIIHALVFLIRLGLQKKADLTQYDLVKSLFLADRAHLNKYGRPITYDNYVAMLHGPVPSLAYDFLKENAVALRKHHLAALPWTRVAAPELGPKCYTYRNLQIEPSHDVLSESDFEELESALTTVKSLTFHQIRKLTHDDPAYVDAWEDTGPTDQYPMSYTLLFEAPNEEQAKNLSFLSKHV